MKLTLKWNSFNGKDRTAFSIFDNNGVRRGTITHCLGGPIPPAFHLMPNQYGWTKKRLLAYCAGNGLSVYWV